MILEWHSFWAHYHCALKAFTIEDESRVQLRDFRTVATVCTLCGSHAGKDARDFSHIMQVALEGSCRPVLRRLRVELSTWTDVSPAWEAPASEILGSSCL